MRTAYITSGALMLAFCISCSDKPVANFGADRSIAVGSAVMLDGSQSENAKTFQWLIDSKPDGSAAALSSTNEAKSTFNVDVAGYYKISLIVKNSDGDAKSTVTVTATPVIALPKTGQTHSCSGNDDATLAKGIDWPSQRFAPSGDMVLDQLTGLTWIKNPTSLDGNARMTWQASLDFVAKLNATKHLGFDDWRFPNINELKSLFNNYGESDMYSWLEKQGFAIESYWSSSPYSSSQALFIGVSPLVTHEPFASLHMPWPVRGTGEGAPGRLAQTGQHTCYDPNGQGEIKCAGTGQDGDIRAGVAWPKPRFIPGTDKQSITDNLTGLVWAADSNLMKNKNPDFDQDDIASDGRVLWQHALDYVTKLNAENYLGHSDWRMPNIVELQSLLSNQENAGADWLKKQGFLVDFNADWSFWSSTCSASDSSSSWTVALSGSGITTTYQRGRLYLWPVRSAL